VIGALKKNSSLTEEILDIAVNLHQEIIENLSVKLLLKSVNLRASLQACCMQIVKKVFLQIKKTYSNGLCIFIDVAMGSFSC